MSGNLDALYDAKLAKLNEQKALSDKMQDMLKNHLVPYKNHVDRSWSDVEVLHGLPGPDLEGLGGLPGDPWPPLGGLGGSSLHTTSGPWQMVMNDLTP